MANAAKQGQRITSAGEWFLDNFYIVEEQIRKAQDDLPAEFYNELPKLTGGPLTGYPRVYGISWALIAHTDGAFDLDRLERFVRAYQEVHPLNIGELWAMAITLRITLVENLRRLIEIVIDRLNEGNRAEGFAQQVLTAKKNDDRPSITNCGNLSPTFIARLEQRLRSQNAEADAVLGSIEAQLRSQKTTSDDLIQREYQLQGADDISTRNVINAMRFVSGINWAEFFESVSLTDRALREYSGYLKMDFPTRDRYRRAVEKLARRSPMDEIAIATAAVREAALNKAASARLQDPGYYLIGEGRRVFQAKMGYIPSWRQRFWSNARATGLKGYLLFLGLTAALILFLALTATASLGIDAEAIFLLALLGFVPATELATALVTRIVTNRCAPTILPALSLKDGIPDSLSTVLVVPMLLTSDAQVRDQVADLEIHYLSNSDARMQFILLSDWVDGDSEELPGDAPLLKQARDGIADLNGCYARAGLPLFVLLHRRRLWNPAQGKWMGWERKRGKLHELNRLLQGANDTSFLESVQGREQISPHVQYVITLDADTRLPRGAAKRLIGKMAHPLNFAEFDAVLGRVSHGYGILQPRVTPSLPIGSESSLFQWAFSGPNGLDPYSFAVSDVYQDLFEEGSFVGKGIYNIEAFERALKHQISENSVLSHDLLEGVFARAGLVSDIEVVEEFPSRYDVEAARQHRWMRGDWQLLPWILGFGSHKSGASRIPALGRWKMLDNIRRSLTPPATLLAFLIGWQLPTAASAAWTGFLAIVISLPSLLPILSAVVPLRKGFSLRGHARNLAHDLLLAFTQILFYTTFLARVAYLALDAIFRTVFRLFVSRAKLLEWVTFAQTAYSPRGSGKVLTFQLLTSTTFVLTVAVSTGVHNPANELIAAPFLLLWLLSPLIARWASQAPSVEPHLDISQQETDALRLAARQTWSFFDKFVTDADNHLPPDNFQETPKGALAHRTSPTNIGMYLNVVLAARDFGWIGTGETVARLEATVATLLRMERYRGHFLNWYDTENLRTLQPRYVSTVDSGNLAGNLMVVQHGCAQMRGPVDATRIRDGLRDTFAMVQEQARALLSAEPDGLLRDELDQFLRLMGRPEDGVSGATLSALGRQVERITVVAGDSSHYALALPLAALVRGIRSHLDDFEADGQDRSARLEAIAQTCRELAQRMEFGFLFDQSRQLLSIGYRVDDQVLDANAYDLLASEARLASFFAIAKGDVPTSHWFHLGRTLAPVGRSSALQSWSGSMFEYLMPSLIMHEPAGSLLALSNKAAVRRQMAYSQRLDIPWGISESQYYALDREQNYQYSGFGIPELGLKRGLSENTVIAPYASGLAAMINPVAALKNLHRLSRMGVRGNYGWYEAIDFTRARLPEDAASVIIKTYMAHHQGMMILGIDNVIHDGAMRQRFHAEPMVQAAELLLQERMPRDVALARLPPEMQTGAITLFDRAPRVPRRFTTPHTVMPRTHLMSNGNYSLMLTASGSGYSRWRGMAVTRWREDPTRDHWGSFIYLRDLRSGRVWSAGYQPTAQEPEQYEARFSEDRAIIRRVDHSLTTVMEVLVSPEDDSEVRRISITNAGTRLREIEVTSYSELALAKPADDDAHQAFSKLFVETEYLRETGALIASRRTRSPTEQTIWAAHLSVAESGSVGDVQYETDRGKFLTRGRNARSAAAIFEGWPLSNSDGAVLDPIFSLRRRVQVPRGQTVTLSFWTMAAATRDDIIDLVDRHHDVAAFERATTLAASSAQTQLQYLGIGGDDAHLFQLLANYLIYHDQGLRAPPELLERGGRPASMLWGAGISGDLPIALVRISEDKEASFVTQMLHAHAYWRQKKLAVDLVILNERVSSYAQDLHKSLEAQVHTEPWNEHVTCADGRAFLLRADLLGSEVLEALRAAARIDLSPRRGSIADQLSKLANLDSDAGVAIPTSTKSGASAEGKPSFDSSPMLFYNGIGGFSPDGHEYIVGMNGRKLTPAPWTNVIANEDFGFQVSAEGSGFCWAVNSQQNQINPWSNDPVSNEPSEVIYLKDLDSGEVFCPTAAPISDVLGDYVARHGQGYSIFEYFGPAFETRLTQFVPLKGMVKVGRLEIVNNSAKPRRLAIFYYVEWALGATRAASGAHIVTEVDAQTNALFARNPNSAGFPAHVAFMDMGGLQSSWTGDRREFLGRHGGHDAPAAVRSDDPLSRRVGGGLDPAGVLRGEITLGPGTGIELSVTLGQAADAGAARGLVQKYRDTDLTAILADVKAFWDRTLSAIQINTPDKAMNVLTNRWLIYQTLSCRFWGRAGFYQASGAYGFRDQLQDSMALCVSHPELAREHLLRAAGRQFLEGDVQHWWLPESGKGVRTRISDDKSWLAYVAAHYLETTGDTGVLDENIAFLQGPQLNEDEHDAFFLPQAAQETATLYEHCARALDASLAVGNHGLPLMGTGDWNDGMNRVGEHGRGESVWLGWFLHEALRRFLPHAERRHDTPRVSKWLLHMGALKEALEDTGWDGAWYRRGYFDDGFALGSASNRECRIDSIAQSWSVISGVATPDRAKRAMDAVDKYLVRTEDGLMTLFTPPFVASQHDPGYIKGYPAGIRENGGQYTHGVIWTIAAFAMLGKGDRVGELFSMINPINHARTRTAANRYRVEPYVACGDVYSVAPNVGRGGWTWYSGSAAWMYRVAIEYMLGIRLQGNMLRIEPVIPRNWPQFSATVRHGEAVYKILVENPDRCCSGIASISVDDIALAAGPITMRREPGTHQVKIILGEMTSRP